MKNITKIFTSIFIIISLIGCKDEDKIKVNFGAPDPAGNFVTADILVPVINGDDIPNGIYKLIVDAPGNNVSKYEMYVRRITPDNITTDFRLIKTVNSFPSEITITTSDLASIFGIDINDLNLGDTFEFLNKSYSAIDGSIADIHSIDADLLSEPGQKQAYKLSTQIICPIPFDYAVGTYLLEVINSNSPYAPAFDTQEVDVKPVIVNGSESVYQRTFSAVYLEWVGIGQPAMNFEFVYFCGTLNAADNQPTGLGCGGGILIKPGANQSYSLNFDDDSVIIIDFVETLNACGGDVNTTIKLTKI